MQRDLVAIGQDDAMLDRLKRRERFGPERTGKRLGMPATDERMRSKRRYFGFGHAARFNLSIGRVGRSPASGRSTSPILRFSLG
jgi:hypothetical protein